MHTYIWIFPWCVYVYVYILGKKKQSWNISKTGFWSKGEEIDKVWIFWNLFLFGCDFFALFWGMGMAENEGKMQGWLYLIRYNRIGLQYSRKRYFVLEDNCLKSFKSIPSSQTEVHFFFLSFFFFLKFVCTLQTCTHIWCLCFGVCVFVCLGSICFSILNESEAYLNVICVSCLYVCMCVCVCGGQLNEFTISVITIVEFQMLDFMVCVFFCK